MAHSSPRRASIATRSTVSPNFARFVAPGLAALLGSTLLGSGALVAQQTWVVAPQAGPGVDFTSLAAAAQAVQSGDTLLVRAGTYSAFTTSKGIKVLGEPGATIAGGQQPTTVVSLPAREAFVMRGITFSCAGFCPADYCSLQYNDGRIHFEDVSFRGPLNAAFRLNHCAHVTMTRCSGNARGCLHVQSSDVALVDCTFLGEKGVYLIGSPAAVDASTSNVLITGGRYRGGEGEAFGLPIFAAPGLICRSGTMVVAGRNTIVEAGAPGAGHGALTALAAIGSGVVELEPSVQLAPQNGGAPYQGAVNVRRVATVRASATASSVPIELHAPQGHLFGIYAGFPAGPAVGPIGDVWLDESTAVVLVGGVVGATEQVTHTLTVPGSFGGLPLALQAVTFDHTALATSSPAVVIVP
ncbi:MAG: hypothetical protein NXI31_17510 [bacterium]|nr:hypothetical protein [bacterium]